MIFVSVFLHNIPFSCVPGWKKVSVVGIVWDGRLVGRLVGRLDGRWIGRGWASPRNIE